MRSRRWFLGLVPATAAVLLSGCGDAARTSQPSPASSTPPATRPADQRFRYGKHPNQWADLYLPSSGTKHPVVITIHGGGWRAGYDAREDVPFAMDLIQDGIAVWNIEYRLIEAGGGWPMTLADAAAAIELLPTANHTGRLDLSNVIVFGASAGGHLATWAVSRGRIPAQHVSEVGGPPRLKLRGAVAYAAPLDLVYDSDNFGGSTALLDGTPRRHPDRYAAASPYALLPTGVPVTCLHGDADTVVPFDQSRRYVDRARRLGDPAKLITLPGADHPNRNPVQVGDKLWTQTKTELLTLVGR